MSNDEDAKNKADAEVDAKKADVINHWKKMVTKVDERSINILRDLVHSTRRFYSPSHKGPAGPVNPPKIDKLKIATIATALKVPFGSKDVDSDFVAFEADLHLGRAHARAKEFEGEDFAKEILDISPSRFDGLQMLTFRDEFNFSEYHDQIYQEIERSIGQGAKAICFAELAYPHPGYRLWEYEGYYKFSAKLQKYVDDENIVIVAGSYHCLTTQTNECAIYIPTDKDRSSGIPVVKPSNDSPRYYTKRVPAQKAGEIVRRPPHIDFPHYSSIFGNFAVMVCFDTFDPTLFLRFLAWHHHLLPLEKGGLEPHLDLIFVPSYSDNSLGWQVAKDLSYTTRSIVVYVDGPYDSTKYGIAICGQSIKDTQHTGCILEDGNLAIWEVDVEGFRHDQQDLKDQQETADFWRTLADKPALTKLKEAVY